MWSAMLDEAFHFVLPNHDEYGHRTKGEERARHVYDSTAINALSDRVARDHGALFPNGERWMGVEIPAVPEALAEAAQQWAAMAIERFHAAIERSNFHLEIEPALREAHVSTGCIAVSMGAPDNPLVFEAVPIREIAPEPALDGTLKSSYRRWSLPGAEIKLRWPKAELPPDLEKAIADDPNKPVPLCDALAWDEKAYRYTYRVYAQASGHGEPQALLHEHTIARASPRICFRVDKAAGEWMGRGPVLLVLPDIRTANKTVELVLKNASIAVTGIWQADDDGVLNPSTVKLIPGTIIPKAVGSAGLQPLQTGARFDVSELVLATLRESIRRAVFGPDIPAADQGDRRSATEYAARLAQQASVEVPRILRLQGELMQPLGAAVFRVLTNPAMAASPYYIEPFQAGGELGELYPSPQPPLTRLREMQEANRAAEGVATVMTMFPEQTMRLLNIDRFIENQLLIRGVRTEDFKTREDLAAADAQAQQAAQLQALTQAAAAASAEGEAA